MSWMYTFLPAISILGGLGILAVTIFLFRFINQMGKKRSPFTEKVLRNPGESLRIKLEEINDDLVIYFICFLLMPISLYAIHLSELYFKNMQETISHLLVTVFLGLVFFVLIIFQFIQNLKKRRKLRLGYEGEIEVGQRLNQMMREGYYVYHDFQADCFNIDHIVVGRAGLFAVETKTRSKPTTDNRTLDAKVVYDGNALKFPNWSDTKSLHQAKRQADWLSKWISRAVGDHIRVQPIVALPGWFVERKVPANGLFVINPKQFPAVIKPREGFILEDSMITRIVHQLEQKCRDIERKGGDI